MAQHRAARRESGEAVRLAAVLGVSGMVAAFAASRWSVTMDLQPSRIFFACLMIAVAVLMVVRRTADAEPTPEA
jgi:uncharacterized membrane protein YfcA